MTKLTAKIASAAVVLLGAMFLSGSIASAASSSISNTGPDSRNIITHQNSNTCKVNNNNNVNIQNNNSQSSNSGNASVSGNTSGGNATSGSASNSSSSSTNVNINNSGCGTVSVNKPPVTSKPEGGMGAVKGAATQAAPQVQAPVGGVGAGVGSLSSLIAVAFASLVSGTFGVVRLAKAE